MTSRSINLPNNIHGFQWFVNADLSRFLSQAVLRISEGDLTRLRFMVFVGTHFSALHVIHNSVKPPKDDLFLFTTIKF